MALTVGELIDSILLKDELQPLLSRVDVHKYLNLINSLDESKWKISTFEDYQYTFNRILTTLQLQLTDKELASLFKYKPNIDYLVGEEFKTLCSFE